MFQRPVRCERVNVRNFTNSAKVAALMPFSPDNSFSVFLAYLQRSSYSWNALWVAANMTMSRIQHVCVKVTVS